MRKLKERAPRSDETLAQSVIKNDDHMKEAPMRKKESSEGLSVLDDSKDPGVKRLTAMTKKQGDDTGRLEEPDMNDSGNPPKDDDLDSGLSFLDDVSDDASVKHSIQPVNSLILLNNSL